MPCLAVVLENGVDVVVYDQRGSARIFSVPPPKGHNTKTNRRPPKICFSTHGQPGIDDLLTPCFDEYGNHGEPNEVCFCGVSEPHIHAHFYNPETCSDTPTKTITMEELMFSNQLVTLYPQDNDDQDHHNATTTTTTTKATTSFTTTGTSTSTSTSTSTKEATYDTLKQPTTTTTNEQERIPLLAVSERLPKECNSKQLKKGRGAHPHAHPHAHGPNKDQDEYPPTGKNDTPPKKCCDHDATPHHHSNHDHPSSYSKNEGPRRRKHPPHSTNHNHNHNHNTLHKVQHDDHVDYLVHNPHEQQLHLEHLNCDGCHDTDVHGNFQLVTKRTLVQHHDSQDMEIQFFEVSEKPFSIWDYLHSLKQPLSHVVMMPTLPNLKLESDRVLGATRCTCCTTATCTKKMTTTKPASVTPTTTTNTTTTKTTTSPHTSSSCCSSAGESSSTACCGKVVRRAQPTPVSQPCCSHPCCATGICRAPNRNTLSGRRFTTRTTTMATTTPSSSKPLLTGSTTPTSSSFSSESSTSPPPMVMMVRSQFVCTKICCSSEIPMITNLLEPLEGVGTILINVPLKTVYVDHDPHTMTATQIEALLQRHRFGATMTQDGSTTTTSHTNTGVVTAAAAAVPSRSGGTTLVGGSGGGGELSSFPNTSPTTMEGRSVFYVEKICCASEIPAIHHIVDPLEGISNVRINVTSKLVYVNHNVTQVTALEIQDALNQQQFGAHVKYDGANDCVVEEQQHTFGNNTPTISSSSGGFAAFCKTTLGYNDTSIDHDSSYEIQTFLEMHYGADSPTPFGDEDRVMEGDVVTTYLPKMASYEIDSTNGLIHIVHNPHFITAQQIQQDLIKASSSNTSSSSSSSLKESSGCACCDEDDTTTTATTASAAATNTTTSTTPRKNGETIGITSEVIIIVDGVDTMKWIVPDMKEDIILDDMSFSGPRPYVILSGIFWVVSMLSFIGGNWEYLQYVGLLSVIFGLPSIFMKALGTLRRYQFDANCMMLFATLGALALQEFTEAAAITFLFSISEFLEVQATSRARKALSNIVQLRPEHANLIHPATKDIMTVPATSVPIGAFVSVRFGDKIPCDGIVMEGHSTVDESTLTGESRPVKKGPTSKVSGGTINTGVTPLKVCTTSTVENSAVARLIRLVEEAQANRSPTEKLVDEFARRYTPVVLLAALFMCTIPWAFGSETGRRWTHNGLVLIIVACPCALIISTPVSYVAGLAATAQRGIVIKGGAHLEALGLVKKIAFDKTGTLTAGEFALLHLEVIGDSSRTRQQVLQYLSKIESNAAHPLSQALVKAARNEGAKVPREMTMVDHEHLEGEGITAIINNQRVHVGNERLFRRLGLFENLPPQDQQNVEKWAALGGTVGYMSIEGEGIVSAYCVADAIRPEATEVVSELQTKFGIDCCMLTGDRQEAAFKIGSQVGLAPDEIFSQLFPEDKLNLVVSMKESDASTRASLLNPLTKRNLILFVGDGVNDAPAMATANVGVAMGAGAALAMETSDVTLLDSHLSKLIYSIKMGRRVIGKIKENVIFSLVAKAVVVGFALMGKVDLWAAIASDVGAMLIVTLNGMRLLPARKDKHQLTAAMMMNNKPGPVADVEVQ